MAALTALTTVTQQVGSFTRSDSGYRRIWKIVPGDGASTYPTGGVPINNGQFGCLTKMFTMELGDTGQGDTGNREWVWNSGTGKLMAFVAGVEVSNATVIPTTDILVVETVGY